MLNISTIQHRVLTKFIEKKIVTTNMYSSITEN